MLPAEALPPAEMRRKQIVRSTRHRCDQLCSVQRGNMTNISLTASHKDASDKKETLKAGRFLNEYISKLFVV